MDQQALPGSAPSERAGTWQAWLVCLVAVFALRLGLYYASQLLAYKPHVSLWFPAAAATFAAYAVFRGRALIPLFAAPMASSLLSVDPQAWSEGAFTALVGALFYAGVHCLAYCALAEAVMRTITVGEAPSLARTINVFLVGGLLAAVAAAVGGVATICLPTSDFCSDVRGLILPWLIGDYVGLLALGPLLLFLMRTLADRLRIPCSERLYAFDDMARHHASIGQYGLKTVMMLGVVVSSLTLIAADRGNQPLLFLVFVAIVLQLWMVHTQTVVQSLVSIALFSVTQVAIVAWLDLGDMALVLQCATITLAAGSYYGMAVPALYAHNVQLRKVLTHDALTGVHVRHFFVALSDRTIRSTQSATFPTSMLAIDLDGLKTINDRYGHAAGDRALVHAVGVCERILGGNDLIGRIGGDEFCVLLPGRDLDDAMAMARRLVTAMHASRYPFAVEAGESPGICIGVATTWGGRQDDHDSLWRRAESALQLAMRRGAGRIASEAEL